MFNISDFLKKFAKLEGNTKASNAAIEKAFFDVCGIPGVQFELKKGIVTLKGSPMLKSAVFMKKGALIERLSKDRPDLNIYQIR